jgi:hypothetical protein
MGVEHMSFNTLVKKRVNLCQQKRVNLLTDDAGSTSLSPEVAP